MGDDLIHLDLSGQRATIDGRDLHLTGRELRLMSAFCRHPGRALTPSELLDLAWGGRSGNSVEQVKLYVSYLRRKLDATAPGSSSAIETLRGTGYRYSPMRSALP